MIKDFNNMNFKVKNLTSVVYQKALIRTFHTNFLNTPYNLCEFTALEQKLIR